MKRILTALCALAVVLAGSTTALAAEARSAPCYYPISVEEYTVGENEEPRISKVYQLSLADDPAKIPTEDFERDGREYYLLDMTRKNEVGVDTQALTKTVTQASDTNNMEKILQKLEAEMEVTTEDGYTGKLRLDHTSVQVAVDGYKTSKKNVSTTRSYPNLSEADVSLIPKSVDENGKTMSLADVKWSESPQTDGEGNPVVRYTATASYTGTTSRKYATGYTVTANYVGEVAKTDCSVVTYTAIFGCRKTDEPVEPEPSATPDSPPSNSAEPSGSTEPSSSPEPSGSTEPSGTVEPSTKAEAPAESLDLTPLIQPLIVAGVVLVLMVGGMLIFKKIKSRR